MTDQQTTIEGERTIQYRPTMPRDEVWQGRIAHPDFEKMTWTGPHVESVIRQMDAACGPRPEPEYQIVE